MNESKRGHSDGLWAPSRERALQSLLTQFMASCVPDADPLTLEGYRALHAWSLCDSGAFWRGIWDFCRVLGDPGPDAVERGTSMLDWKWFPHATLNFAENLLRPDENDDPSVASRVALTACDERGQVRCWTREELLHDVLAVASFLASQGIVAGDRVAAVVPNDSCALIGYLASVALGAVWSSCSPDFGPAAIADRFRQIEPTLLITSVQTQYHGKSVRPIDRVQEVLPQLPSVRAVLVSGLEVSGQHVSRQCDSSDKTRSHPPPSSVPWIAWEEALSTPVPPTWRWERFAFDHPLCIVYSSGTTGVPKCIVHAAGGTLLQHLKEHQLHSDVRPGDRLFYYTTTGWMMWNWLTSALASQATVVAYDGSPVHPGPDTLWRLAIEHRWTHFGASARYYAMLDKSGVDPRHLGSLQALRCVLSTGSPLLPETFDWIYRAVASDVNLASISGGTDILSCFVLGHPNLPVHRGEIQCKGLGMDVQVLDAQGRRVVETPGELVCAQPFPSMPIGFWNDPDGSKYRSAYFEAIPGVWCHGDWALETQRGGFVIYGRSDATLNPGGVRIGTAEIYQQLESFDEIAESLATAWKQDGDEAIALFVRMAPGHSLTEDLKGRIRSRLRQNCSPRHVPAHLVEAPDLPRTISGKLSEIAVRNALCGTDLGNAGALANPDSLQFFRQWRPS